MRSGWVKQGLVLAPPLGLDWSATHVALPTVDVVGSSSDLAPMYFATRDATGRSSIARSELDLAGARPKVARLDPQPVLRPGALGAFDDAGVTPSCVVSQGSTKYLYFTGWSLGVSVPFYLAVGLAVSEGGGAFERVSAAPILGRSDADPYMTASPHVLVEDGRWRMWYVSCVRWTRRDEQVRHHYHIRYGESDDGITWRTDGHVCVDFADECEYAFSRPCVTREEGGYEMWYSVRGDAYRLGLARSLDGLGWERFDGEAGMAVSPGGWDSEMIAYPHVLDHNGRRLMLYNGNGYGASGIGSAVRDAIE